MASKLGELYSRDQVPEHFKELFIISGYRNPTSSLIQCVYSVFTGTNETLNFWTHFLPTFYFVYKTYIYYFELDFTHDAYTFPLLTYMLTLCLFPFTSAIAHLFNTMSDKARHICFFLDYWGLSQFSVGTAIAYNTYIFPELLLEGGFHRNFLHIAIINGMLSFIVSCHTRFMKNGMKKKLLRMAAYGLPYLYVSLPIIYRLLWCLPHECEQRALGPHMYQFVFALLAAVFYVSHWPERSYPGRFDIIGHSHQIFHLFTVIGPYIQMTGLFYDLRDRRDYLLKHHNIPSITANVMLMLLLATINIVIFFYYVIKINRVKPTDELWFNLYGCKNSISNNNSRVKFCCEDLNENVVTEDSHAMNGFEDGVRKRGGGYHGNYLDNNYGNGVNEHLQYGAKDGKTNILHNGNGYTQNGIL